MKSLLLGGCFIIASLSYATNLEGLQAYRQGEFIKAKANLTQVNSPDKIANYYLARMYLYGYGELKNNNQALQYFNKAAESGVIDAQLFLGKYALNKQKDPQTALYWFKKAATINLSAQLYCAAAYSLGYGVKKNTDIATKYLADAAKKGDALAQYYLAVQFLNHSNRQDKKLGLIWLNKAVKNHSLPAQLLLGRMYEVGKLVDKDHDKALELLMLSANQRYIPALIALSAQAVKEKDFNKAEEWLLRAAYYHDSRAEMALSELYADNKTPLYNPNKSFLHLLRAAQDGSSEAQLALAKRYQTGDGVSVDSQVALQWQQQALQQIKVDEKTMSYWLTNEQFSTIAQTDYRLTGIESPWQNSNDLKQDHYNASPQMPNVSLNELYLPNFTMILPNDTGINEYFTALLPLLTSNNHWSIPRYPLVSEILTLQQSDTKLTQQQALNSSLFDNLLINSNSSSKAAYQAVLSRLYQQAILGESAAEFELGQLYHYGVGVNKNPNQALIYYQLAAQQQDIRADYNIGLLYIEGAIEPLDYKKGVYWLTSAAFKGNAYAQYVLAKIYQQGLKDNRGTMVIPPDKEQSEAMLYLAAANHLGKAQYELANILIAQARQANRVNQPKMFHLIKSLYEQAANQGVKGALVPTAFYYAMSSNPKEQNQAFEIASAQAHAGNSEAAILLGLLYDRGVATVKNQAQAIYWYQKAELNPVSAFILGTYYSKGIGLTKDTIQAEALLQQAAHAEFTNAYFNLAILAKEQNQSFIEILDKARQLGNSQAGVLLADYYLTLNNPDYLTKARTIYQFFAEKGDKNSQLKLAYLYDKGLGGTKDELLAFKWYTAAAEEGQPIAQYLLGYRYQLGFINQEPNYQLAKQWYEKSMNYYPKAAIALGFVLETVEDNYNQALFYYEKEVNSNPEAQYNLALIYSQGKGRPVDLEAAKKLFIQAANQGHAESKVQLALMQIEVDPASITAKKLLQKAASNGNLQAAKTLEKLNAKQSNVSYIEPVGYTKINTEKSVKSL